GVWFFGWCVGVGGLVFCVVVGVVLGLVLGAVVWWFGWLGFFGVGGGLFCWGCCCVGGWGFFGVGCGLWGGCVVVVVVWWLGVVVCVVVLVCFLGCGLLGGCYGGGLASVASVFVWGCLWFFLCCWGVVGLLLGWGVVLLVLGGGGGRDPGAPKWGGAGE
ncbi:hypothetical protein RA279_27825, partial [Pseudomonas syringae pv. tagetis]|uniref:hypothetical protein n=1 Tax=Pseudomonas syringae group genomosp. 7 TaxID=251699 RepID=UPI00377026DC